MATTNKSLVQTVNQRGIDLIEEDIGISPILALRALMDIGQE